MLAARYPNPFTNTIEQLFVSKLGVLDRPRLVDWTVAARPRSTVVPSG